MTERAAEERDDDELALEDEAEPQPDPTCKGCGAELKGTLELIDSLPVVRFPFYCGACLGARGPAGAPNVSRAQVAELERLEAQASGVPMPAPRPDPIAGLKGRCDTCGVGISPAFIGMEVPEGGTDFGDGDGTDGEPTLVPKLIAPTCPNATWCPGVIEWPGGIEATASAYLDRKAKALAGAVLGEVLEGEESPSP